MGRKEKRSYKLRTSAEKQSLLKQYKASGESISAFCDAHGLSLSTFHTWVVKDRKQEPVHKINPEAAPVGGKFIELPCETNYQVESPSDTSRHSISLDLRLWSLLKVSYRWRTQ